MQNIKSITSISINNYRVFNEEQTFELKNLQFLIGPNNVGKSTVQHFINLMKLCTEKSDLFNLDLFECENGSNFCFGENIHRGKEKFSFRIGYNTNLGKESITYVYKVKNDYYAELIEVLHCDTNNFTTTIKYLGNDEFNVPDLESSLNYHFDRLTEKSKIDKIIQQCSAYQAKLKNPSWRASAKRKKISIIPSREFLNEAESVGLYFANKEQLAINEMVEADIGYVRSYFYNKDGSAYDFNSNANFLNEFVNSYKNCFFKTPLLVDAHDYFINRNQEKSKYFKEFDLYTFDDFLDSYYNVIKQVIFNRILIIEQSDPYYIDPKSNSKYGDFLYANLNTTIRVDLWWQLKSYVRDNKKSVTNRVLGIIEKYYLNEETFEQKKISISLNTDNNKTNDEYKINLHYLYNQLFGSFSKSNELLPNFFKRFKDLSSFLPQKRYYMLNEDQKHSRLIQKLDARFFKFINSWLEKLEIADELIKEEITFSSSKIVIGYSLFIRIGKNVTNLFNCGTGAHKIISLLISIFTNKDKGSFFIIEEPEVNLHPAFQSYLADILVDANKNFNCSFIVETHSEYIIRRLRLLIVKRLISNENCIINYFQSQNGKTEVKPIEFTFKGQLTDNFGTGFFDEASNLSIELLRSVRGQKN